MILLSSVKTFTVEIEVHLLNIDAIDIDNIVAKNEVENALERVAMIDTELITAGSVKSVEAKEKTTGEGSQ